MSSNYSILNPEGIYFVTLSTVKGVDVFTTKIYRDIILKTLRYFRKERGLIIFSWCIMSNHVYMILSTRNNDLSEVLRDMKEFTCKEIMKAIELENDSRKEWMLSMFRLIGEEKNDYKKDQFWQEENHSMELLNSIVINEKLDYIHENPVKAGIVEEAESYIYSSARDYSGIRGLLKIEYLE